MKPVILEMTAFGSYAKPTTVDFQKWNHSLYLIAGDTGAGKTTIFDAIMVALYGVASGKGDHKARTFEMMHCDYVEKSTESFTGWREPFILKRKGEPGNTKKPRLRRFFGNLTDSLLKRQSR